MKIQIGLALVFLVIAPAAATAQSQEDQQACMNDAFGLCGAHIPDRERVQLVSRKISTASRQHAAP